MVCNVCGKPLSMLTVWVDNGGFLCREHALDVIRIRNGENAFEMERREEREEMKGQEEARA